MWSRYASFPYQCPIRDLPNGSYQFVSRAPFKTRRVGMMRGNWGWEQACFHTYLTEQEHGALRSLGAAELGFFAEVGARMGLPRQRHRSRGRC